MAEPCVFCAEKIGFFNSNAIMDGSYFVCDKCFSVFNAVLSSKSDDEFIQNLLPLLETLRNNQSSISSRELISFCLNHVHSRKLMLDFTVEDLLNANNLATLLDSIRHRKIAEEQERAKEEQQRERERLAKEEQAKKEREAAHQAQMEYLREKHGGYYEYKVISLFDHGGLFNKNSGRVDTETMSQVLNELGMDGWHLVTAYSNELGKNAFSGGVGGAVLGTNSTIDENILIFERFIKL